jgi:hypothetical protein
VRVSIGAAARYCKGAARTALEIRGVFRRGLQKLHTGRDPRCRFC